MNDRVLAVDRIVLRSFHPRALADFFVRALAFEVLSSAEAGVALKLGETRLSIELAAGRPYPGAVPAWSPLFQHFAIATTDMAASLDRLRHLGARTEAERCRLEAGGLDEGVVLTQTKASPGGWSAITRGGPQRLPANTGGVTAFKFRDPDGHPLELIEFPGDIGAARIDHSAISVGDVGRSIAFYEALGLTPGAHSFNHGPEQDALDNLDHARLDVVALEPPRRAPHVELLAYRAAVDEIAGRAYILNPNDVAATRIVFSASTPIEARLFQDPDGHWLEWEVSPVGR